MRGLSQISPQLATAFAGENLSALKSMKRARLYRYYLNYPSSEIITNGQPLPPGTFNDLDHCLLTPNQSNPNQLPNQLSKSTLVVDPYGLIQIAGYKRSDPSNHTVGVMVPDITNCLGVIVKDLEGNITAQHAMISQGYSAGTVLENIRAHQKTFDSNPSEYLIRFVGMALEPKSFKNLPVKHLLSDGIDPNLLTQEMSTQFPGCQLQLTPNKFISKESIYSTMQATSLLATNNPDLHQIICHQRIVHLPNN